MVVQAQLNLTKRQIGLCKEIWQQYSIEMGHAQAERVEILAKLQSSNIEGPISRGVLSTGATGFSQTVKLLDVAAELAANSALQTEIALHSHRRFNLQVCSPQMMCQMFCNNFPHFRCMSETLQYFATKC